MPPRQLLPLGLVLLVAACAPPPPVGEIRDVALGQPFTVEVGEAVRAGDRVLRIVSVEDERCPESVECVWPGEAIIHVALGSETIELRTQAATPKRASPFEVWEVTPYPGSQAAQDGAPTRVTMAVLPAGD